MICKDVTGVGGSLTRAQPKRVATFPVYLPPLNEQKQIINHIETKISKLDKIIKQIKKEINLIKEYKTSLINEAVTGKIKIKGINNDL